MLLWRLKTVPAATRVRKVTGAVLLTSRADSCMCVACAFAVHLLRASTSVTNQSARGLCVLLIFQQDLVSRSGFYADRRADHSCRHECLTLCTISVAQLYVGCGLDDNCHSCRLQLRACVCPSHKKRQCIICAAGAAAKCLHVMLHSMATSPAIESQMYSEVCRVRASVARDGLHACVVQHGAVRHTVRVTRCAAHACCIATGNAFTVFDLGFVSWSCCALSSIVATIGDAVAAVTPTNIE
jgi:hypothetical protein